MSNDTIEEAAKARKQAERDFLGKIKPTWHLCHVGIFLFCDRLVLKGGNYESYIIQFY